MSDLTPEAHKAEPDARAKGAWERLATESLAMSRRIVHWLLRLFPRRRRDTALDAYFDLILSDYAQLEEQQPPPNPKVAAAVSEAAERWRASGLRWSEVFALERRIFHHLPLDTVAGRAWYIRDRYEQVVSKAQYEAYDKNRTKGSTGAALLIEMDSLLSALAEYYILRESCDSERAEFSHRVQVMTFVLLAVIALLSPGVATIWRAIAPQWIWLLVVSGLVYLAGGWTGKRSLKNAGIAIAVLDLAARAVASHSGSDTSSTLMQQDGLVTTLGMDVMAGLFGGAFSMLQRVQAPFTDGDGLTNLLSLRSAKKEVFLAPITGAVAAMVLYCIFAAGLITGDLFPNIVGPKAHTDPTQSMAFLTFLTDSGPAGAVDHAKSLVWSFIAGFSERFVPDSISRLTTKAAQSKAS